MTTVVRNATVVDGDGRAAVHTDVAFDATGILAVGGAMPASAEEIDARGRVLMPGFVDCHTHLCWAGDRMGEWAAMVAGTPYLELLEAGGGILSTVRATRAASRAELTSSLSARIAKALREGTTTLEVKSGYGLTVEAELTQLHAIHDAAASAVGTLVATALLGHALDAEQPDLPARIVSEALPAVREAFGPIAVDAYIERGAWSVEQGLALFRAARAAGHPIRMHVDQFTELGMVDHAIALGATTVDHLEATGPDALARLGASTVTGVLLPISGLHTDGRYADGRTLLDAGGTVAIATNANPGSAPSTSMPLAIALAVRHNGLTPMEAITAATHVPAQVLGLPDRGRVAVGLRADLILLEHTDPRALAWSLGGDPVQAVWVGGARVRG